MKKSYILFILLFYIMNLNTAKANSLDVVNADIKEVLTAIASEGNINIVIDENISGNISLKLSGISPEEMIKIIAKSNNYTYYWEKNIFYVSKNTDDRRLYNININYLDLYKTAEMINLMLNKNNIKIQDIQENNKKDRIKSGVVVDESENLVTFYATKEEYLKIKSFLQKIDIAPKQISLEAKVTAIQKDAEKNMGISWEWSSLPQSPTHDISYDTIKHTVENEDGSISQITDYIPVDKVSRQWQGGNNVPGVIRFGKGPEGYPYEFYYMAQLNALISDGKASILAKPNIMTIQGNEAIINIGSEVPVPKISTTDSTTTTSIEYKEAGIILKCIPRINEEGIITVKIHTEVSSPLYVEDMKAYRFQKRSADTTIRLKDGQTMVIGGLIGSDEAKQMDKIPFLGDIPILGNLFKHIKKTKSDTELMIFLTAKEVKF